MRNIKLKVVKSNLPAVDSLIEMVMPRNNKEVMEINKNWARNTFKALKAEPKEEKKIQSIYLNCIPGKDVTIADDCTTDNFHDTISSHLLLYRLVSLFRCGIITTNLDYYKVNWTVILKGRKGSYVYFGEWKGSPKIWVAGRITPTVRRDIRELVTLLIDPELTIDYDGTIAGSQA